MLGTQTAGHAGTHAGNTHLPPRPHVVHCFPPHVGIVPWRACGAEQGWQPRQGAARQILLADAACKLQTRFGTAAAAAAAAAGTTSSQRTARSRRTIEAEGDSAELAVACREAWRRGGSSGGQASQKGAAGHARSACLPCTPCALRFIVPSPACSMHHGQQIDAPAGIPSQMLPSRAAHHPRPSHSAPASA